MVHKTPSKRSQKEECKPFDKKCVERAKSRIALKQMPPKRKFAPPAGKKVPSTETATKQPGRAVEHKMTRGGKTVTYWKGSATKKSTFAEREAMRAAWRSKNKGVSDKKAKPLTDKEVEELRKKMNLK